jgi:hypothetical protein
MASNDKNSPGLSRVLSCQNNAPQILTATATNATPPILFTKVQVMARAAPRDKKSNV